MNDELMTIASDMLAVLESQSDMCIGKTTHHPDGRLVTVIDGQYLSNGRVSNWWTWRPALPKKPQLLWTCWAAVDSAQKVGSTPDSCIS